jgi:hypothetical protein
MIKHSHTIVFSLFSLLVTACAGSDDPSTLRETGDPIAAAAGSGAVRGVSSFRTERGPLVQLRDEPAAQAFASVAAVGSVAAPRLAIYQLAAVPRVEELARLRAGALAMAGAAVRRGSPDADAAGFPSPVAPNVYARQGSRKLRVNAYSGAELFADDNRFHRSPGVATLPLAEPQYVDIAQQYVKRSGGLESAGVDPASLYTYKVRRYMDAGAAPDTQPVTTTYQVSVAFNQSIDDLPVVGAGSKFVVHLSPTGEVIGHEQNLRAVSRRLAALGSVDLVAPEAARKDVEHRLRARGINLDGYVATRSELGYLRLGRDSIQSVLAPHYFFVYEPRPGVLGKKLVEFVPATRNPAHLALLADDDKLEQTRKATLRTTIQPDQKGAETAAMMPRLEKEWAGGASAE